MRRANFFFAFSHKNKVYRQLATSPADGMQRRQESSFRTFLIDRAATNHNFAKARLIDNARFPRRRRPFRRIYLLDVIHEIESQGLGSAGIQRSEDSGLSVGG